MTMWMLWILVITCVTVVLIRKCFKAKRKDTASVLIVAGSGGHTAEILRLVKGALDERYRPRIYVVAQTDHTSTQRIIDFEEEIKSYEWGNFHIVKIPRSREVRQSWLSTVFSTLYSILYSSPVVYRWKPDLILCNGPGTCVPVCLVAVLFKFMSLLSTKVIYVESICRVYDLSFSAKILLRLVDVVVVQWPELHALYPNTVYVGRLS